MRKLVAILPAVVPERVLKHDLFQRASFIPSLLYNLIRSKMSGREWYSRIDDSIVLGALPFRSLVEELLYAEGVTAVISLNQDFELRFCADGAFWRSLEVEFLQIPTADIFAAPDADKLREGVLFILDHMRRRGARCTVYVHCKAGRTRSATLVGCYLMQRYGYTPDECVKVMQAARSHILLVEIQMAALEEYYERYVKPLTNNKSSVGWPFGVCFMYSFVCKTYFNNFCVIFVCITFFFIVHAI